MMQVSELAKHITMVGMGEGGVGGVVKANI